MAIDKGIPPLLENGMGEQCSFTTSLLEALLPLLGKGSHDHKPPHLSGERKGFEEKREASQRYHMEAQLKSPLWEKHLPRALHAFHLLRKRWNKMVTMVTMVINIAPLLEKGSGLGQRPLPSSGDGKGR